jgi:hypothetical protein
MDSRQKSWYVMELATKDYLAKNGVITELLPNFSLLFAKYQTNLVQIEVLLEMQSADKTGIAKNKKQLHDYLSETGYAVAHKVKIYAQMNDNVILASELNFSKTDFNRFSETELRDKAQLVYNRGIENLPQMAQYNLTAEELTTLKNWIDLYNAAIPSTRIGQMESKQITMQLADLMNDNERILGKIDLLVDLVEKTEPAFYSGYKEVRHVITKSGSLALTAYITDASTGEGLRGVKVLLTLQGNGSPTSNTFLEKTTAEKGCFKVKNLAEGMYTAKATKVGYKEQTITLSVASGDMANLNMTLEKF